MTSRRRLALAIAFALAAAPVAKADEDDYRLGPQDKLRIKVYDWRGANSDAHEWTPLTGVFEIGASGKLFLPLIGETPAARHTAAELAAIIGEKLQHKIGLPQAPDASVEVATYRPFYITGRVDKPGEYAFRPGMTVLEAISIAGGVFRRAEAGFAGYERDAVVSRGEIRMIEAERLSLVGRRARLEAEAAETATLAFPAELVGRLAPEAARIVHEEQMLFDAHRETLRAQLETLTQTKALLVQEVASLKAKGATLARQLDLARRELDSVAGLVSKGLAVTSRQLALDQNVASYESTRLDIELAMLRTQQDIAKTDRDAGDLRAKRRNDALTDLSVARERAAQLAERAATAQQLVDEAEIAAPRELRERIGAARREPVITITRRRGETLQAAVAQGADSVEPGDVISLEPSRAPGPGSNGGVAER